MCHAVCIGDSLAYTTANGDVVQLNVKTNKTSVIIDNATLVNIVARSTRCAGKSTSLNVVQHINCGTKNTPFYFSNNFVKPHCILIVFGTHMLTAEVYLQQNCDRIARLS